MRGLAVVVMTSLFGCVGDGHELATVTELGLPPTGQLFWLTFDPDDDSPWIGMSTGLYRWTGADWTPLPTAGLTTITNPYILFDRAGNAMVGGQGTAYRLPRGGTTWEALNSDGLLYETPVEASDGTLYAPGLMDPITALRRVYYRRPNETAWTDCGTDIIPGTWPPYPIVDRDGNIWVGTWSGGGADDGLQRIHEQTSERIPMVWSNMAILGDVHIGIGADSRGLLGASTNYAMNFGEVYAWDPVTKARTTLTDGTKCGELGDFTCETTGVTFIGGNLLAPNGDIYEMLAPQNGEPPTLLVLENGDDTWWPLYTNIARGLAPAVSPKNALYLFGNNLDTGKTAVAIVNR